MRFLGMSSRIAGTSGREESGSFGAFRSWGDGAMGQCFFRKSGCLIQGV
jgi:hypothetical protein